MCIRSNIYINGKEYNNVDIDKLKEILEKNV